MDALRGVDGIEFDCFEGDVGRIGSKSGDFLVLSIPCEEFGETFIVLESLSFLYIVRFEELRNCCMVFETFEVDVDEIEVFCGFVSSFFIFLGDF